MCSALTGSSGPTSVGLIVTFTGGGGGFTQGDIFAMTFPSTTKSIDAHCELPTIPGSGAASPIAGCAVTTTLTADMIIACPLLDYTNNASLQSSTYDTLQINTIPGSFFPRQYGCFGITAGAPGSSTATFTYTGTTTTAYSVNTVAYKLSTSGATPVRQPAPYIINFKPRSQPNSVPRSIPRLSTRS